MLAGGGGGQGSAGAAARPPQPIKPRLGSTGSRQPAALPSPANFLLPSTISPSALAGASTSPAPARRQDKYLNGQMLSAALA